MSKFLFEGNFKRKPVQNLGGRSRHAEDRDAVLQKAQMERQKRENERARFAAVQVLQAAFRGMRERKKLNLLLRQEFQKDLAARYTIDSLERQMIRLNYFFKLRTDVQLLCDLGKAMLILKDQLMVHMLQDERSMLRVRLVLEKALLILSDPQPQTRSTILRLLETFTDWAQVEKARVTMAANVEPARTEEVVAIIWSHLVLQRDFFSRYRTFLNSKMEVNNMESARKACQHYDFTIFYQRFLEAVRRLSYSNRNFIIGKMVYPTKELVQCLLLKLAESLSHGILRYNGKETNGVLEYLLCPRVANLLAREYNGKSLWNDEWMEVILRLAEELKFIDNEAMHATKLRPVMYSFLIMVHFSEQWSTRQTELLNVLNALMVSIDNRKMVYQMPDEDDIDYDDEDSFMDDIEMKAVEEAEAATEFFHDRQKIYEELQIVLNNMQLHDWINEFTPAKWNLLYQVMSCIIEMEPLRAAIHFQFISALYNNPRFMRALCIHVMRKEVKDKVELVVFCWLLSQLMKILHDGEFLDWIPLTRDELLQFVKLLEDIYTDIVLSDKDVSDRLECYFKREIASTLMTIHDRNTRIHIFPEDVFISSKFSVVFPMETHGIRFKDFSNVFGALSNLSLLDQRLLRVLNDFPFALSFHDRVSIWHQILHSDHVERHVIDNPMGRQHIQIRRSYIYEDAFEKLSSENVPDLRSDVRISLVNVVGVQEAGVDGGGLLREFLTEATKAGVDPNRGLFRVDSENRIYPNPIAKRIFPDFMRHFFFMGRLVGKALYRQILLELPLAAFFMQLSTFGTISSAVDYLATLDPDLHKNLLKLKTFDGDWSELGLDFTVASDELGEAKVVELKPDGRNIAVDKDNVIEYIHLVADYKINKEIMEECRWFRTGLLDVVPVLRIFSWKEMQTLISGSDKPINVKDWKEHTNYAGGYNATHSTIEMFWQVVEHFDEEYLRKLLKFVTSCSRPPLLGFKDLVPKFGISNAGVTDRLPTAATCMNLLKLPEFGDIETLRERLVYAINAQAGFELS